MIKVFRHIRQRLLSEGKTGKYFKYAIGEILLVVIGILIAVQINSWNQDRNRVKLETVLLEQLRDELFSIYGDIRNDNNILKMAQNSHLNIMDYIDQNVTYNDSMCFDFYWIKNDEYIYPKDAIYGRIKEEGLDIITNDTIRNMTQAIYESVFPRLSRNNSFNPDISEFLNDYYIENFTPNKDFTLQFKRVFPNDTIGKEIYSSYSRNWPLEFNQNGIKRLNTIGFVPLDFESLKNDSKFQMLLTQVFDFRNYKLRRYRIAKNVIRELIELIDKELDQNKH